MKKGNIVEFTILDNQRVDHPAPKPCPDPISDELGAAIQELIHRMRLGSINTL